MCANCRIGTVERAVAKAVRALQEEAHDTEAAAARLADEPAFLTDTTVNSIRLIGKDLMEALKP